MSEEESPDLTKSWVFVDSEKQADDQVDAPSGVEEVPEDDNSEPHADSDTDSISVISESGCSYKTDEEEFTPAPTALEEESNPPEITEVKAPEPAEAPNTSPENETVEKLLYFATSAVCALILIGFSILVQYYFYPSSNVNKFAPDFEQQNELPVSPYVQNVKNPNVQKSYNFKRKTQVRVEEAQMKMSKNQKVDVFHDKIPSAQIKNNDLTVEDDVKSNYKRSKNKSPATKFNKENYDDSDKRAKNDEFNKKIQSSDLDKPNKDTRKYKKYEKTIINEKQPPQDETLNKKLKELRMKEAYLREKEKFLIEKEHHLMKKEIKLNQEKHNYGKNKYEKKAKKDKENKHSTEEHNSKEKKDKPKPQKNIYDEKTNPKNNKKYKKRYYDQNRKIMDDTQNKKRNISGQWYIDLHKARNNIRQKEHASDWVFDRAHLRSLKRNKAHWYFQWMVDRARLRVK